MIANTRRPILWSLTKMRLAGDDEYGGISPFMAAMVPMPTLKAVYISGVTKDSAGTALPNCNVRLYRTAGDVCVEMVTSDGSGNYIFSPVGNGQNYYVVAYKPGSPDVAGTTRNDLIGT